MIFPDAATNRIEAAAARRRAQLATGLKTDGTPITVSLAAIEKEQDLTHIEWFGYQNAQARAHATGKLSTAEAQTIYMALGGEVMSTSGWSSSTDLALKLTIVQVMGELMGVGR